MDAARFITNLNQMIHGFVAGNLIVGSVMALATTLVLWKLGVKGAIPLGIASGLLNLLPFLGLIAALALPNDTRPLMGAWSQNTPARGVLYSDASVRPRVESNRHRLNVNGGGVIFWRFALLCS
jgi:hypothetical protein